MHRWATADDLPALTELASLAIDELQAGFLTHEQVAASHRIMGIDSTLVHDGTYVVVEQGGGLVGCGGWSRRATLYGGDGRAGRDPALLDPRSDPARVRAMYTHPDFARRGVGRLVLSVSEAAARAEGFRRLELVAALAGRPLYEAAGFEPVEELVDTSTGVPIPLVRMVKPVSEGAADPPAAAALPPTS